MLAQYSVIVEDHIQLEVALSNRENEKTIINSIHISINATLKINVRNIRTEKQIRASDVDWWITGSQIV